MQKLPESNNNIRNKEKLSSLCNINHSKRTGKSMSKSATASSGANSGEKCDACQRVFRDADHLAKHRRGALCRRLIQRVARRHRKMALMGEKRQSIVEPTHNQVLQPQQRGRVGFAAAVPVIPSIKKKVRNNGAVASTALMPKPYQCTVCGARFYDKVNVELHLERQHRTAHQLWVEVAKGRDQVAALPNTGAGVCIGDATDATSAHNIPSTNSISNENGRSDGQFAMNIAASNCLDMSNNSTNNNTTDSSATQSRLFTNETFKCLDCNSLYHSQSELLEHRRTVHHLNNTGGGSAGGGLEAVTSSHNLLLAPPPLNTTAGGPVRSLPGHPYLSNTATVLGMTSEAGSVLGHTGDKTLLTAPRMEAGGNGGVTTATATVATNLNVNNHQLQQQQQQQQQQQLFTPGYIFPSTYYGSDLSQSLQQTTAIHPHTTPYLQQQQQPHHQLLHPHHQQQHQQHHHTQQQQHQEQDLAMTSQPHNPLLQSHHHNVAVHQTPLQLHHPPLTHHNPHHHPLHHQAGTLPPPPPPSASAGLALQQHFTAALPVPQDQVLASLPPTHPPPLAVINVNSSAVPLNNISKSITMTTNSLLDNHTINNTNLNTNANDVVNSINCTTNNTIINHPNSTIMNSNVCTSNNSGLYVMSAASSNAVMNSEGSCGGVTSTTSRGITNNAPASTTIGSTVSVASSSGFTTNGAATAASSTGAVVRMATVASGATKWNMCGECGIKFLDLMNLELHIERKHPRLQVLGSVDLGEGTVCYKTGVVNVKTGGGGALGENSVKGSNSGKLAAKEGGKVWQRHTCCLCNHKTTSLVPMVDHMLNVHFLTGKSMMDSIMSEGETGGDTVHANRGPQGQSTNQDQQPVTARLLHHQTDGNNTLDGESSRADIKPSRLANIKETPAKAVPVTIKEEASPLSPNQCHSCRANFSSASELIRHRIKDKSHTCIVCCYVTCSKKEMMEHTRTEHDGTEPSFTLGSPAEVRKTLTCWRCAQEFKNTGDFIEHLKVHGSLMGKCEKCGKQDYNVANILIHMTTLHSDYMNKLSISIMCKGKTYTCTYLQTLTGDLVDLICFKVPNKTSNDTSRRNSTFGNKNNSQSSSSLLKNKLRKKRLVESDKSKRSSKVSSCNEAEASSPTSSRKQDKGTSQCRKVYGCSQCRVCLYGSANLERHLQHHQKLLTSSSSTSSGGQAEEECGSDTSLDLLGVTSIKRSPSEEGASPPPSTLSLDDTDLTLLSLGGGNTKGSSPSTKSNSSSSSNGSPSTSEEQARGRVGLERLPGTLGFQCQECGLTKNTSLAIITHIQKVHISGNLVHMVIGEQDAVKYYPIYIVTPLSVL